MSLLRVEEVNRIHQEFNFFRYISTEQVVLLPKLDFPSWHGACLTVCCCQKIMNSHYKKKLSSKFIRNVNRLDHRCRALLITIMILATILIFGFVCLVSVNRSYPLLSPLPGHSSLLSSWSLIATAPHDSTCFTQGFEFLNDTIAVESCGLYRQSRVQLVDFSLHRANASLPPQVLKRLQLPPELFAEGITLANGELYLLTWKNRLLIVLDPRTLSLRRQLPYPLEGWGIAYRPSTSTFLATDGSQNIFHLSIAANTVSIIKTVPVVCNGRPVYQLNELEMIGNDLLANVWLTDQIYKINPDTGNLNSGSSSSEP